MCYVHPIHPTLCAHNYYRLLAVCSPNASLRTCPSSQLIVTGPPGWDGRPKLIENGLCPRCDLGNDGVDLSRVRFYKPEKTSRRRKSSRKCSTESGPRWSIEGNGLARAKGNNCYATMGQAFPSPMRKLYAYSHSVQSLPTPSTLGRIYDDDSVVDYGSDTDDEFGSNSRKRSHRACRWMRFHIHRHNNTNTAQVISGGTAGTTGHGRRRERLKTVLKSSLSPLKGMMEGIEQKLVHRRSRSNNGHSPAISARVEAGATTGAENASEHSPTKCRGGGRLRGG